MKFLFTPTKVAATEGTGHNKCHQERGETGTLCITTGCKVGCHFGHQCADPQDPTIPPPDVRQRMIGMCSCDTYTPAVGHMSVIPHPGF